MYFRAHIYDIRPGTADICFMYYFKMTVQAPVVVVSFLAVIEITGDALVAGWSYLLWATSSVKVIVMTFVTII